MADPFVAEVRIFPFNFPPKGWAFCDGQILPISQNTALFALLGTTYGGNGQSTFALPNVQGSAVMHPGQGPGLSQHFLGEVGGEQFVTLLQTEMPIHPHSLVASQGDGTERNPNVNGTGQLLATGVGISQYQTPSNPLTQLNLQTITPSGGSLPHNNMQPYLTLNFCIALQGVFPPRP
ncbi:MAG TPA: tail fiber protein [Gaiellaceae bacterium]|nr:tail fiber protein [Gaiellaceae bacterium]